jgi:hypothetical protein
VEGRAARLTRRAQPLRDDAPKEPDVLTDVLHGEVSDRRAVGRVGLAALD